MNKPLKLFRKSVFVLLGLVAVFLAFHFVQLSVNYLFASPVVPNPGHSWSEVEASEDILYADLLAKKNASELEKDKLYRITDFRTYHLIPNTAVYNTGTTEPLVVRAVAADKLSHLAYSETYPQDIIYYELEDSSTAGGDRGRIYYREDTYNNISVYEDWRNVKYRRWETAPASGIYTVLTDNSGDYVDRYMFNDSSSANSCFNVSVGRKTNGELGNNILGTSSNNEIGNNFYNNTIGSDFNSNIIGNNFYNNTIGSDFNSNIIGNSFYNNIIGNGFLFNTIGNIIYNNIIGNDFYNNTIGNSFYNNTIEDRVYHNTIGNNFIFNVIGSDSNSNIIGNDFYNNTIGHDFKDNTIGNYFHDNVIGSDFYYNTIGHEFGNITIGNIFSYNTLLDGFSNGKVSVSITGLSTLDVTVNNSNIVGIVNVTSINATENINLILNSPSRFDFELRPESGLALTLTGTAFAAINADGQILLDAATLVLDGSKGESAIFRQDTINGYVIVKLIQYMNYQ